MPDTPVSAAVDEAPADVLSPLARRAWGCSFLSEVSADIARELLRARLGVTPRSGQIFYRGAHHADMAMLGIVASGRHPDLRALCRRATGDGSLRGSRSGDRFAGGLERRRQDRRRGHRRRPAPTARTGRLSALAQRDGRLAFLVARYLAGQLAEAQDLLATDLFTDVRTRVARHLLDLASIENGSFVVVASHQAIADAIGSVREVVTRSIRRLDAAGLIKREGRLTVLLNPAALTRWHVVTNQRSYRAGRSGRSARRPSPASVAAYEPPMP